MISTRLAKLKFIVEEMQLAFHLAKHVSDPFIARTLARHILIRAENFIEHARGLRKPLNSAGFDTSEFHRAKEVYAENFQEYFKTARDRLGAHVQDFDFGKRIDLWNDNEIVKISYFVDGALEIYRNLSSLKLPGYAAHVDPPELTDPNVIQVLDQFQRAVGTRSGVEIGADSLAMTRNNTIAVLNMTPVHQRAGQLALIRRWIAMERDLVGRFDTYPRIASILKARIVTDIVSCCDCLVTRPVASGAPQEMGGLDKLIAANGQSPAPIQNFVAATHFQVALQTARTIRDAMGAHVEIDEARTIASLIVDLDSYDLSQGLNFFEYVYAAFYKTCLSILYLRTYVINGQLLYGVSSAQATAVPYAGSDAAGPPAPPERPQLNNEEEYRINLTRWLDGDQVQKGIARDFFWNALAASCIIETIDEVEHFSSGHRISRHEFRLAHQFLSTTLADGLSDADFQGTIELIISCRGGWPYPLAEILVRNAPSASVLRQWLICHALGEIGSAPHTSVSDLLEGYVHSES